MKKSTLLAMAASLALLSGCVVVPATTTATETPSGTTTVTTTIAPPALPAYEQPAAPGPGYLWTPGYWAWGDAAYYWVPGVWVLPPRAGVLWTPGWWGWSGGIYRWHVGYWGPTIGFYGGINYGFGYFGTGYAGGYWHGDQFYYNRTVNNIHNTRITNVYVDNSVTHNGTTVNRVSYNGGSGGATLQPNAMEKTALHQPHAAPTAAQVQQHTMAVQERGQRYDPAGHGPAVYGTSRVSEHLADPAAVRAAAVPHPPTVVHQEAMPVHSPAEQVHERAQKMPERAAAEARETARETAQMERENMQPRPAVRAPQNVKPEHRVQRPHPHHEREHEER